MAFIEAIPRVATLSFDAAQAVLAANAIPLGFQTVSGGQGGPPRLQRAVHARIDAPRYDTAAMVSLYAILICKPGSANFVWSAVRIRRSHGPGT
jgi:hypothetical protein